MGTAQRSNYHLTVHGRVQGVGFRYSAKKAARDLMVTGYVKNLPDGSVFIEIEGLEEALEKFIMWCEQGPSWSRVDKVIKEMGIVRDHNDFSIR